MDNHCFRNLTVGYYLSEDDDSRFLHMIIPWLIQKLLNLEYWYGVQGQSGKAGSLMVLTILSGAEGPVHPDLDQKKWWTIHFSVKDPFCCDFADEHKHTVRGGPTWVEHWCVRWWVSSLHLQQSITTEFGFYSTCKHLTQHPSTSWCFKIFNSSTNSTLDHIMQAHEDFRVKIQFFQSWPKTHRYIYWKK
jgi:hypothetical protein